MNTIFYFRVSEDESINPCATLDARNKISELLIKLKFSWIDMVGGQSAFDGDIGLFELFEFIVNATVKKNGYNLLDLKHCPNPGTGLFM